MSFPTVSEEKKNLELSEQGELLAVSEGNPIHLLHTITLLSVNLPDYLPNRLYPENYTPKTPRGGAIIC